MRKDEKTGKWVDIGDKKAAEKTSQALREKTGDEKEQGSIMETAFQSPTPIVPIPTNPPAEKVEPKQDQDEVPKTEDTRNETQPETEANVKKEDEKNVMDDEGAEKKAPQVQAIEV